MNCKCGHKLHIGSCGVHTGDAMCSCERYVNAFAADSATVASYATSPLRTREGDQPLPKEGQELVTEAVIEDWRARTRLGVQRYGKPLQTFNGRNAKHDLYEELLDAVQYAKQDLMETDTLLDSIQETWQQLKRCSLDCSSDQKCNTFGLIEAMDILADAWLRAKGVPINENLPR